MKFLLAAPVFAFLVLAADTPARAQEKWEISPFVGYETPGSFPVRRTAVPFISTRLRADGGVSFGTNIGYAFLENVQFDFMWNRNLTSFSQQDPATGVYSKVFDSDIDQFLFGGLVMFRNSETRLRPFISTGIGFTHEFNSGATPNKTNFSFSLGTGVKYYVDRHFALRSDIRWIPTYASSSPRTFCDIFGSCFIANVPNYLHRVNFSGGFVLRF